MITILVTETALLLASDPSGGGSVLMNPDVWRVINILLFVAVLVYILRNKIGIGKVFDDRGSSIVRQLEQAKQEKDEALQRLKDVEARLAGLDQEIAAIRQEAETEAIRETERIRETAMADAEKVRQMASREIDGAMKAAKKDLREFVAENSVAMAESIIRREIRPEDNSRLFTRYVDELREVTK